MKFEFKLLRSHFKELFSHLDDHGLDVFTLGLEHLNVLVIFFPEFFPQLLDEVVFSLTDLFKKVHLGVDFFLEFLALFKLFQVSPFHLQGGILLVGVLRLHENLLGTLDTFLLILNASIFFKLFIF